MRNRLHEAKSFKTVFKVIIYNYCFTYSFLRAMNRFNYIQGIFEVNIGIV